MENASPHASRLPRPVAEGVELKSTSYERASIGLTSILMLFGTITFLMFLIWLSSQWRWDRAVATVGLEDVGGGGQGDNLTEDRDMEIPGMDEIPELAEPQVEQSLESITQVVASQDLVMDTFGGKGAFGEGEGTGIGDGRGPGQGLGTGDGIPAWDRWEVRWSASDLSLYKRQLDFFGIEFGIAGGGIKTVDYVKNFTAGSPAVRRGQNPKAEKRIRFLYRDGPLKQADRTIAADAGVNIDGRIVFHFYSDAMYKQLLALENEKMRPRPISEVLRTVFGIRPVGNGFEFYVIRQDYRTPNPAAS
ncbi:MAG TPA: hypothetical protein VMP01_26290 [Pirellulaceae bacterium]|nr:hypothetical protein [Pirellulaceae bacterium]